MKWKNEEREKETREEDLGTVEGELVGVVGDVREGLADVRDAQTRLEVNCIFNSYNFKLEKLKMK